jgi:hypothetical protein
MPRNDAEGCRQGGRVEEEEIEGEGISGYKGRRVDNIKEVSNRKGDKGVI